MADKRVIVYDTTLNVPDELTAADRAEFPGGFVCAGAAGDMGAQKLVNVGDATADGDALVYDQLGAQLQGLNLGAQKLTNLIAGTVATDGITKAQLDAVAAGADSKSPCRVATLAALPAYTTSGGPGIGKQINITALGILAIDGVNTVLGDRILIKDEAAAHVDHGIYEVVTEGTGGVAADLERVADFDGNPAGEVKNGNYVYVLEGTQSFTGWMLNTADPITVDTTALDFGQFQGLPAFTWGAGLLDTANTISVELDTAADAQSAGTGGGSSGLEMDAAGDGGQIRAAVNAAGGLERTGTGLAVRLDGTTLGSAAAGLSVDGLPALFEVAGVAVGATVTAANLDTLMDGSNADVLHIHTAAVATEAPKVENTYNAQAGVAVGDPVHFGANDEVAPSDASTLSGAASHVMGVARTSGAIGNPIDVVTVGPCVGVLSGAGFGDDYFLENGTGITNTNPTGSGKRRLWKVGYAINATDLFVDLQDLGIRTMP